MENKPYDLIALDWNGTLLDDVVLSTQCISKVARHFGKPDVSVEDYRKAFRFPIIEYYRRIGLGGRFKEASKMYFDLYNDRKAELNLFPDAVEFIKFCKGIASKVVILTAGRQDIVRDEVLDHDVNLPVWGASKMPSEGKMETAAMLNYFMCTCSSDPRVLLVGDTVEDCECAKVLDWDFYAVATGHCSKNRLLKNTNSVAGSLSEVKEHIMSDLDLGRN